MAATFEEVSKKLQLLIPIFARRIARAQPQGDPALPEERTALLAARVPITSPLAQDYMTWRRAMVWGAALCLAIATALSLVSWVEALQADVEDNPITGKIQFLVTVFFLAQAAATFLMVRAGLNWVDAKRSRRDSRWAWALLAGTPVVLSVIPWFAFSSDPPLPEIPPGAPDDMVLAIKAQAAMMKYGPRAVLAALLFTKVGPLVISLSSGAVRGSLLVKTLLPEATGPGWVALIFAPLYVLVFLSFSVWLIQIQAEALIILGIGCLAAGQIYYLFRASDIIRPYANPESAAVLPTLRKRVTYLALAGSAFIVIALLQLDVAGFDLTSVLELLVVFLSGVLTVTVVAADFGLALTAKSVRQAQVFFTTPLADSLDTKLNDLEEAGLARLRMGYATSVMQIQDLSRPSGS